MTLLNPPLAQYEKSYTSQFGEDGIIEHALSLLPSLTHWCVEFGAWDGKYLSNTYHLITSKNYSAVLIEGDKRRFADLQNNFADDPHVLPVNQFVQLSGSQSLDAILSQSPIPRDFDLLSIDIDGADYHVWDSLQNYRPKIVVIEFNPTIPTHIDFVQPADTSIGQGSSIAALYRLARAKGYRLIACTVVNAVFVGEQFFPLFSIQDDSPAALRTDLSRIAYLFQTYDGRLHVAGNTRMLWHHFDFNPDSLQVLPRFLRVDPERYSPFQRACWWIYQRLIYYGYIKR